MPRCHGFKPDGSPCVRIVRASETYCYAHDPDRQQERKHNASKAGKSRPNREIGEIKRDIRSVISAVLAGELKTAPAAVGLQGLNTLLRAMEVERKTLDMSDLSERLNELEQRAKRLRGA